MKYLWKFLVVVIAVVAMHGCGSDEPSINDVRVVDVVKKDPQGGIQRGSGPYDWECSTQATCNTAFLNAKHNDVIFIHSGTYTWSTITEYSLDSTITIIGEDTTAVLKLTDGVSTERFFTFMGSTSSPYTFDLTIENVKFLLEGSDAQLLKVDGYDEVLIKKCVMDRDKANTIELKALTLTVDSCRIDNAGEAFLLKNVVLSDFTYVIKNSTLRATGTFITQSDINKGAGTISFEDNDFMGTASLDNFHNIKMFSNSGQIQTANFRRNDLKDRELFVNCMPAGSNQRVIVNYTGNNETAQVCWDQYLGCGSCTWDVTCNYFTWYYNDSLFSFDDFGPITNQNVAVTAGDVAYVEFSLASTDNNEVYQEVWARYGDDNCGAGASQAEAWYNSTTGKWNTTFDVSGFTDGEFYWRGKGKLCDKIVLGSCDSKHFQPGGSGGDPPTWFKSKPK